MNPLTSAESTTALSAAARESTVALIAAARDRLAKATSAAELLDASSIASVVYSATKAANRFAKAKGAADEVITAAWRLQADALEIEVEAKRRLADEYDAAQERGEIRGPSDRHSNSEEGNKKATAADIGLTPKEIHEARQLRDAHEINPDLMQSIRDRIEAGHEPTKAALRAEINDLLMHPRRERRAGNPLYDPDPRLDAVSLTVGACSEVSDLIGRYGAGYIATGFLDEAHRDRECAIIEKAHRDLSTLIEACSHGHA